MRSPLRSMQPASYRPTCRRRRPLARRACAASWLLSGAALLASCDDTSGEGAAAAPSLEEWHAGLSDDVWITTSRDSIELIQRTVGRTAEALAQRDSPARRDEVALRVPRASLLDISEAQHTAHRRCAGFMLQDSEADALAALAAPDGVQRDLYFLAPPYTLDNAATVDKLLPEIKEPNVLATIRKLSSYRTRFHTSTTGEEAALYIRDTWKSLSMGRSDITVELVDHVKTPQPSIKLTMRGTSLPNEIVVLGGHMDSISGRGSNTALAPGADDNASGIAVLTEVLRAAIAQSYRPARTVVFYGYAAEEIGLVGSAEIAARAKSEALNVVGVLQLDMTNFTTASPPFIGLLTDFVDKPLTDFTAKLIDQYVKLPYKLFECGYACSDHASWTKNGFPSVSPHEADMKASNQQIHTTNDTLALSKDSAAHSMHFVRLSLAFMAELAKGKLDLPPPSVPEVDGGMAADAGGLAPGTCKMNTDCAAGQSCERGRCSAATTPVPACSASAPCPSGLTCIAGACGVAAGSSGTPDATAGLPDASAAVNIDAGVPPPTMVGVNAAVAPDASVVLTDSDDAGGCAVAAPGQTHTSAWAWFAALGLCALRPRRRTR